MYKEIIKPTLVLIIISVLVGTLLAVTYNVAGIADLATAGLSQADLEELKPSVMPAASSLKNAKVSVEDGSLLGVYADEGGSGTAIHIVTKGYGGDLKILVGVDTNGAVTGAAVTESAETPNLGSTVGEPAFIEQFVGKSGALAVDKDGGEIAAVAGATISSRAFTDGINKALEIYEQVKGEL